jgi:hypothetical protein
MYVFIIMLFIANLIFIKISNLINFYLFFYVFLIALIQSNAALVMVIATF